MVCSPPLKWSQKNSPKNGPVHILPYAQKSVNLQNKHGGSIRSYDCYLKRCVKNSLTKYSFYVMEFRVSSDCTRNIHRPSSYAEEEEVNRKDNTVVKSVHVLMRKFPVSVYLVVA